MSIQTVLTREEYAKKSKEIFRILNEYRKNPKLLIKQLEHLKKYVDTKNNVLAEPGKFQVQMAEGMAVFNDAIEYLSKITHLEPLILDENLCKASLAHCDDIGPKGELTYQSSDGTEPEERIQKYGNYVETLGENIDFGPGDAMNVIVSLTLDDGEPERPHRENLFKPEYKKVGIGCGIHKTEFQMCVMDFALDFTPLETENIPQDTEPDKNINLNNFNEQGNSYYKVANNPSGNDVKTNNQPKTNDGNRQETTSNSYNNKSNSNSNDQNSKVNPVSINPLLLKPTNNIHNSILVTGNQGSMNNKDEGNYSDLANKNIDVEDVTGHIRQLHMDNKKLISKQVEVTTRVVYYYEDGTSKEVTDKKNQTFLNTNK